MSRSRLLGLTGYFFLIVFAWIAIGAVLGLVLFPLLGPFFGHGGTSAELMRHGARFGSFYFMIWAPGLALVLTVRRAYHQKKTEPSSSAP